MIPRSRGMALAVADLDASKFCSRVIINWHRFSMLQCSSFATQLSTPDVHTCERKTDGTSFNNQAPMNEEEASICCSHAVAALS